MKKRTLTAFLFFMLIFYHISGSFTVSAVYENTYINTGDGRVDIVEIAKTQIGYYEGIEQYAGYTRYGDWYHQYMGESSGFITAAWCAMFVSWCSYQAGTIDKTGSFAYCPYWVTYFKDINSWQSGTSGYVPRKGDIIFFTNNGTLSSHVGIVYEANSVFVYTIEGNTADSCAYRSYSLNSTYILGYGTPNYTDEGDVLGEIWRVTASSGLNLRGGAGTEHAVLELMPYNTQLLVTEKVQVNGVSWGKTYHSGRTGYFSLSYAAYIGEALAPEQGITPPVLPEPIAGERVYITGCNTPITAGAAVVVDRSFNGTNTVSYSELVISWAAYLVAEPTHIEGVYRITQTGNNLQSGNLIIPEGGIIYASHCDDREPGTEIYIKSSANRAATGAFNTDDFIVINGVDFATGAVGVNATLEKHEAIIPRLTLAAGAVMSIDREAGLLLGVRAGDSVQNVLEGFSNTDIIFDGSAAGTGSRVYITDGSGEEVDSLTIVVLGDLNGDGEISSVDYLMIKRAFLGTVELSEPQHRAGLISGGSSISSMDYLKIKRHFLGTYNIYNG